MKTAYARFLPHIDNNRDFAELISEMQGELNASHTGGRYRPTRPTPTRPPRSASSPTRPTSGEGVRVLEVIERCAAAAGRDQGRAPAWSSTAIDGATIAPGANWYPLLNRKAGTPVRLSLLDPASQKRWEETRQADLLAATRRRCSTSAGCARAAPRWSGSRAAGSATPTSAA